MFSGITSVAWGGLAEMEKPQKAGSSFDEFGSTEAPDAIASRAQSPIMIMKFSQLGAAGDGPVEEADYFSATIDDPPR